MDGEINEDGEIIKKETNQEIQHQSYKSYAAARREKRRVRPQTDANHFISIFGTSPKVKLGKNIALFCDNQCYTIVTIIEFV